MVVADPPDLPDLERIVGVLRQHGGRFAFLHGSRATGAARPDSDVDVAVWFGRAEHPAAWELTAQIGGSVDMLVLDGAPLELAGRVAMDGLLLFDDDPPARVAWQADTRVVYLDEEPLQRELDRLFKESRAHGR